MPTQLTVPTFSMLDTQLMALQVAQELVMIHRLMEIQKRNGKQRHQLTLV